MPTETEDTYRQPSDPTNAIAKPCSAAPPSNQSAETVIKVVPTKVTIVREKVSFNRFVKWVICITVWIAAQHFTSLVSNDDQCDSNEVTQNRQHSHFNTIKLNSNWVKANRPKISVTSWMIAAAKAQRQTQFGNALEFWRWSLPRKHTNAAKPPWSAMSWPARGNYAAVTAHDPPPMTKHPLSLAVARPAVSCNNCPAILFCRCRRQTSCWKAVSSLVLTHLWLLIRAEPPRQPHRQ